MQKKFCKQICGEHEYYYCAYTNANGMRLRIYAPTEEELIRKIKEKEVKQIPEELDVSSSQSLGEFVSAYLNRQKSTLRSSDFTNYNILFHYHVLTSKISHIAIDNLSENDLKEFFEQFYAYYKAELIERLHDFLLYIMTGIEGVYGLKIGVPTLDLSDKTSDEKSLTKRMLTNIILEGMKKNKQGTIMHGINGLILSFVGLTGCSIQNLVVLKWKNVAEDLSYFDIVESAKKVKGQSMYITVPCEKKRIYLSDTAKKVLEIVKENKTDSEDSLTFATRTGGRVDMSRIKVTLENICISLDFIRKYTIKDMYICFGTILLDKGVTLPALSKYLGHSSLQYTCNMFEEWISLAEGFADYLAEPNVLENFLEYDI